MTRWRLHTLRFLVTCLPAFRDSMAVLNHQNMRNGLVQTNLIVDHSADHHVEHTTVQTPTSQLTMEQITSALQQKDQQLKIQFMSTGATTMEQGCSPLTPMYKIHGKNMTFADYVNTIKSEKLEDGCEWQFKTDIDTEIPSPAQNIIDFTRFLDVLAPHGIDSFYIHRLITKEDCRNIGLGVGNTVAAAKVFKRLIPGNQRDDCLLGHENIFWRNGLKISKVNSILVYFLDSSGKNIKFPAPIKFQVQFLIAGNGRHAVFDILQPADTWSNCTGYSKGSTTTLLEDAVASIDTTKFSGICRLTQTFSVKSPALEFNPLWTSGSIKPEAKGNNEHETLVDIINFPLTYLVPNSKQVKNTRGDATSGDITGLYKVIGIQIPMKSEAECNQLHQNLHESAPNTVVTPYTSIEAKMTDLVKRSNYNTYVNGIDLKVVTSLKDSNLNIIPDNAVIRDGASWLRLILPRGCTATDQRGKIEIALDLSGTKGTTADDPNKDHKKPGNTGTPALMQGCLIAFFGVVFVLHE